VTPRIGSPERQVTCLQSGCVACDLSLLRLAPLRTRAAGGGTPLSCAIVVRYSAHGAHAHHCVLYCAPGGQASPPSGGQGERGSGKRWTLQGGENRLEQRLLLGLSSARDAACQVISDGFLREIDLLRQLVGNAVRVAQPALAQSGFSQARDG